MNADRLIALYERVADAPEAVGRLRRFILDLAVRGKLVNQDPSDEAASELLERIAGEQVRLANLGQSKKPKPIDQADEPPFDLPGNWAWSHLAGIASYIQRGKSPEYAAAEGAPVISQKCVQWAGLDLASAKQVTLASLARYEANRFLCDGDLLWNSTGTGTIGRVIRLSDPPAKLICDSHVTVVRCIEVDSEYVRTWLRSDHVYGLIEERASGSTNQVELTAQMANSQLVPLPPLAEQRRIVAKVDELMALLDRLEAGRHAREATRDRMAAATLASLTAPKTPAEDATNQNRANARFALNTLPALTTRPDQIKALRQTILNLAVRGKLVEQNKADEPATVLYQTLSAERAHLISSGSIPRPKPSDRAVERTALNLPPTWEMIALGDVANLVTSGSRGWAEFYSQEGPGFVRAQNIRFGKLLLDDLARVQPPKNSEGARTHVENGDLLIVITGAGVTNPALLDRDIGQAYVSQHVGLVRPTSTALSPWLLLCLMAEDGGRAELMEYAYGSGKPGLNLNNLRSLSVPLSPLAEQRRIVAKVEALMALCDQLEAALKAANTTRTRLLENLLHEALEPGGRMLEDAA